MQTTSPLTPGLEETKGRISLSPQARLLDAKGRLVSDLWVDQPEAAGRIEEKLAKGEISAEQGENLQHFVDRGYLTFSLDLDQKICDQIDAEVERLWQDRPQDVAYAYQGLLTPFSEAESEHRKPTYRIADLQTHSEAALTLYLQRQIFDYVELIFGEPAVATQSLYFEWGSQQHLHRDPAYVHMTRASHLLAAWIALEDVGPDSGPLVFMPGSHRLPYYLNSSGQFAFDHSGDGDEEARRAEAWDRQRCREANLVREEFICRRGDVLIWHHSLLHGGAEPKDPSLTRKSFVVHFSTRSTMPGTQNTYRSTAGDQKLRHPTSQRLLTRDGCQGFDSPLHVSAAKEDLELLVRFRRAQKQRERRREE